MEPYTNPFRNQMSIVIYWFLVYNRLAVSVHLRPAGMKSLCKKAMLNVSNYLMLPHKHKDFVKIDNEFRSYTRNEKKANKFFPKITTAIKPGFKENTLITSKFQEKHSQHSCNISRKYDILLQSTQSPCARAVTSGTWRRWKIIKGRTT